MKKILPLFCSHSASKIDDCSFGIGGECENVKSLDGYLLRKFTVRGQVMKSSIEYRLFGYIRCGTACVKGD